MTIEQAQKLARRAFREGRIDQAREICRQLLALDPAQPETLYVLACCDFASGRESEAADAFVSLAQKFPDVHELQFNCGEALRSCGRFDEALVHLDRAIVLKADDAPAHVMRSFIHLARGDFDRGFAEFEWRWQTPLLDTHRRSFAQPRWDGSDPSGKTILLYAEQGLGDVMHMIRYAKVIAERGGSVVVGCQREVVELIRTAPGVNAAESEIAKTPAFDLQVPMLSLPHVMATGLATIPANVPYLFADEAKVRRWEQRLSPLGKKLKVGLAWAGSPRHLQDRNRSIPLAMFAPLAKVPNVTLLSMQKGSACDQVATAGFELIDWTADLHDMSDTAALVANVDLVISVDSAVAHLAGAMGKSAWVLLPFVADWRWLLNRDDSPWYPTMRLFRQPKLRDWPTVIDQVAKALRER